MLRIHLLQRVHLRRQIRIVRLGAALEALDDHVLPRDGALDDAGVGIEGINVGRHQVPGLEQRHVQHRDHLAPASRLAAQRLSPSPARCRLPSRSGVIGDDGDVIVAREGHGPGQADRLGRAGAQSLRGDRHAEALLADVEAHRQAGLDLRTASVADQRGDGDREGQAGSRLGGDRSHDQVGGCAANVHRKRPSGAAVAGLILGHDPQGVPSGHIRR